MFLKCLNICKKNILNNICIQIKDGDIVALLGPNGAGKTTFINIILGLQKKDSGKILIDDNDMDLNYKKNIKLIGSVMDSQNFYTYLTGMSNLKLKARIYKIDKLEIDKIVDLVGLSNKINDKVRTYSLGMKQRLNIAMALLNKPKILIMDEPTNGLDINGIIDLKKIIKKLSEKGVIILISTHMIKELDDICNKICILKNGTIIENETTDYLIKKNINYLFEVNDTSNINLLFKHKIIDNSSFCVWCNKEFIPLIIESLNLNKIKVYGIKENLSNIEEIYLSKLGG